MTPLEYGPSEGNRRNPSEPRCPTPQDVAWALANAASPWLRRGDRNRIYAKIGAGEYFAGISELLVLATDRRKPLTSQLAQQVTALLDTYMGNPSEPPLRELLNQTSKIAADRE